MPGNFDARSLGCFEFIDGLVAKILNNCCQALGEQFFDSMLRFSSKFTKASHQVAADTHAQFKLTGACRTDLIYSEDFLN